MADRFKVVYEVLAQFSSLHRETKKAQRELTQMELAEANANRSAAQGAAASAAARTEAANATKKESSAARTAAATATAYAAAAKVGAAASSSLGRQTRQAASASAEHTGALAVETAAMEAASAASKNLNGSLAKHSAPSTGGSSALRDTRQAARDLDRELAALDRDEHKLTATTSNTSRSQRTLHAVFSGLNTVLSDVPAKMLFSVAAFIKIASVVQPAISLITALVGALFSLGTSLVSVAGASVAALPGLAAIGTGVAGVIVALRDVPSVFKAYSAVTKAAGKDAISSGAAISSQAEAVANAEDSVSEAKRDQARQYAASSAQIVTAEQSVASAQRGVLQAQKDLTAARKDALDQINSLRDAVNHASLDERQAELSLERARQNLTQVNSSPGSTSLDKRQAQLDVAQAEQDLADVRKRNATNLKDLNEAEAKGVEGSDQVVAAKQAQAQANEQVQNSLKALSQAQTDAAEAQRSAARRTAQAMQALADAQRQDNASADDSVKAQQQLQAALDKLSPSARAVVVGLHNMSKGWEQVKSATQESFFKPLVGQLANIRSMLPTVNLLFSKAAGAVGQVVAKATAMLSSGPFKSDFATIASRNAKLINTMGDGALSLADAFRHITMAAGPFTQEVAQGLATGARNFANYMAKVRDNGRFAKWLETVRVRMHQWWLIIKNTGVALLNIARAAKPLTDSLTTSLVNITAKWKTMTDQSTESGQKLAKWFTDIKPLLHEVALDFSGMFKALGHASSDTSNLEAITELLAKIRTVFAPQLASLFHALNFQDLADDLVHMLGNTATALANLLHAGGRGAFISFTGTLRKASDLLTKISSNKDLVPILQKVATAFGVLGAATLIGKFTGINSLVATLAKVTAKSDLTKKGIDGLVGKLRAIPGPAKLAALAIAGIAIASPEFRKELTDIGSQLLDALKPLIPVVVQLAQSLAKILVPAAQGVGSVLTNILHGITPLITGLSNLVGWFAKLPGPVQAVLAGLGLLVAFGPKLVTMVRTVGTAFKSSFGAVVLAITAVVTVVSTVVSLFQHDVPQAAEHARQAIGDLTDTLDKNSAAFTEATKQQIIHGLQQNDSGKNYLDLAKDIGIGSKEMIDSIFGVGDSSAKVAAQIEKVGATAFSTIFGPKLMKRLNDAGISMAELTRVAKVSGGDLKVMVQSLQDSADASKKAGDDTKSFAYQMAALQLESERYLNTNPKMLTSLEDIGYVWDGITGATSQAMGAQEAARQSIVALGKATENSAGQLVYTAQGFAELYQSSANAGESLDDFRKRMQDSGDITKASDDQIRKFLTDASTGPSTAGIDGFNAHLSTTISLAEAASQAVQQAIAEGYKQATDPTTLLSRTQQRLQDAYNKAHPSAAPSAVAAPASDNFAAQDQAEQKASQARDAAIANAQAEQKAAQTAAGKIKDALEAQAEAQVKSAEATVAASQKRVDALAKEATTAHAALAKASTDQQRAADALTRARGDVYTAEHLQIEAQKQLQTSSSPAEKSYWQGIVNSTTADAAAARKRLAAAQADAAKADRQAKTAKKKSDTTDESQKAAQKKLDDAETALGKVQARTDAAKSRAEDAFSKAVQRAADAEDAAQKRAEAAYEAVLNQRATASASAASSVSGSMGAVGTAATGMADTAQGAFTDVSSGFDALSSDVNVTAKDMLETLDQDVKKNQQWATDLINVGKLVPPGILETLAKMGPQAEPLLNKVLHFNPQQLHQFIVSFGQTTDAGLALMQAAITSATPGLQASVLGMTPNIGQKILADLKAGIKTVPQIAAQYGLEFVQNADGTVTIKYKVDPQTKADQEDLYFLRQVAAGRGPNANLPSGGSGYTVQVAGGGGTPMQHRAAGGVIPGTGSRDTSPAMLTPGEFVVRKNAVRALGVGFLNYLNNADKYSGPRGSALARIAATLGKGAPVARYDTGGLVPLISGDGLLRELAAAGIGSFTGVPALSRSVSSSSTVNRGITIEKLIIQNPTAERASDSLPSTIRKLSYVSSGGRR